MKSKTFAFFLLVLLVSSCVTVKPYERMYLNDSEMEMGSSEGVIFENYVHSIREGATSAGDTKSGGGCGCN